jgi:hypothetical protein|tara:strand:+ start:62 stop:646 length:585 start_codon:yes stop_codon:yes gene_type:complete
MKKIILTVFAASSLLLYSTPSFAFSLSVGIPMSQTITGKQAGKSYGNVPDKTSGYFLAVQLPFAIGLGIDSYTTKFKTGNCNGCWGVGADAVLKTDMTNIFYQLPVPVVNLIIGLGKGTTEYDCKFTNGDCSKFYEKGSATQWYTSIGMPIIPFFDIHFSYRSITAKNIESKYEEGKKDDNSGSVTGVGIAFNF